MNELERLVRETHDTARATRDLMAQHVDDDRRAMERIATQLERLGRRSRVWRRLWITLPLVVTVAGAAL